jgi:antitoxin (DNA-binding transcriptional repressor) of toxin-antitoxin stability system
MSNVKRSISVTEASRNFADYINRVVYRGERFVLIRGNKAVAEISPIVSGKCLKELPEIFEQIPHLSEDDDFGKDLLENRKSQNMGRLKNPWDS